MKTKKMKLYYQVTKDAITPASTESLERKNLWIREMQKEVPSEWDPIILEITYRISNREVERLRKFFNGPVVEYWIIQHTELYDGRPDSQTKKRARETLLYQALGYEVELMDGRKERARKSTADYTDTQDWNDFLQTLQETEFDPNGYEFPDSKEFWELAEKYGYTKAHEISIDQLQKRLRKKGVSTDGPKTYVFKKEVRKWGVEAGDYYNEQRHRVAGGTDKLLVDGVIEEEMEE